MTRKKQPKRSKPADDAAVPEDGLAGDALPGTTAELAGPVVAGTDSVEAGLGEPDGIGPDSALAAEIEAEEALATDIATADIGAPDPDLAELTDGAVVEEAPGMAPVVEPAGEPAGPEVATRDAVWLVFAALVVALVVAALLASPRIVSSAEIKRAGPARAWMLALGTALESAAARVGLDGPYRLVEGLAHPPEAGYVPAEALRGAVAASAGGTPARPDRPTGTAGAVATAGARPGASPRPGAATAASRRPTIAAPPRDRYLPPGERPPVPPAEPPRVVSGAAPLAVYVAGDSFAQPLAYELTRQDNEAGLLAVDLDFKLGSGVSRMDFFDWPARVREMRGAKEPDVLVFSVGGNDTQPIWTPPDRWIPMGSPEWQGEYARRAGEIMDTYRGSGIRVYWVGLPVLRDEEKNGAARLINEAVIAQAAKRPWVRFLDVWPMFIDAEGKYTAYLADPSGEETQVRQNDGVHLTRVGTSWVAERLYDILEKDWHLAASHPTATPTATAVSATTVSATAVSATAPPATEPPTPP